MQFNSIYSLEITFDVIAISETWLDDATTTIYCMEGYDAFHTVRTLNRGGGVAIYVQECHNGIQIARSSMAVDNLFECICVYRCYHWRKSNYQLYI